MRKTLLIIALLALLGIALAAPYVVNDGCPTNVPRMRQNWKYLTAQEQSDYIFAINALKNRNQPDGVNYDFFVGIHQYEPNTDQAHGTSCFLPWHRYFMWIFEGFLRLAALEAGLPQARVCSLACHYWAWEETASTPSQAVVFTEGTFGTYPGKVPKNPSCVTNGIAQGWSPAPNPDFSEAVSYSIEETCIARQWVNSITLTPQSTLSNMIVSNPSYGTSNGWCMQFQTAPHGSLHDWVGATMADMISPNDPLFFVHHANVDRMYSLWQDFNGKSGLALNGATITAAGGYAQYATSTSGVTAAQCGVDVCFSYLIQNANGNGDTISAIFPQDQASCATPTRMNTIGSATTPGWGGTYYRYGPDDMKTLLDTKMEQQDGTWLWFLQDGPQSKKRSLEEIENDGPQKIGGKAPQYSVDDDNDETFVSYPGDFKDRAIEKKWRQICRAYPELSSAEKLEMLEIYECQVNHHQQYVSDKWLRMNKLSDLDPKLWTPKCHNTNNQF